MKHNESPIEIDEENTKQLDDVNNVYFVDHSDQHSKKNNNAIKDPTAGNDKPGNNNSDHNEIGEEHVPIPVQKIEDKIDMNTLHGGNISMEPRSQ